MQLRCRNLILFLCPGNLEEAGMGCRDSRGESLTKHFNERITEGRFTRRSAGRVHWESCLEKQKGFLVKVREDKCL